jgi:anaerobic ribonucleoside-triphosphate reductase activating protein
MATPTESGNTNRVALHAICPRSVANGPGERFVIWVQGCVRHCPGCFNPKAQELLDPYSHDFIPPTSPGWFDVRDLVDIIRKEHHQAPLEGITLSGGEPFDQPEAMYELFQGVRQIGLTVLVFSGYLLGQLIGNESTRKFIEPDSMIDVLIDGPFECDKPVEMELRGSENQRIQVLTNAYKPGDLTPPGPVEYVIQPDGSVIVTGFSSTPC